MYVPILHANNSIHTSDNSAPPPSPPDAPIVVAAFGRALPDHPTAGEDVYFTCHVTANPPVDQLAWYREVRNQLATICYMYHTTDGTIQQLQPLDTPCRGP